MGSHSGELARARHASSLLVNTLPRQGPRYLQWPGLYSTRMNFLKIVASLLLLVSTCLSSPLHLRARRSDGYNDAGGVYDSAIAQDYWASRFGGGFLPDFGHFSWMERLRTVAPCHESRFVT